MTTKVNPASTTVPSNVVGKDVQIFTVDYIADISTKTGPLSAQQAALNTIQETSTILVAGPLGNSDTEQTFMTEGADSVVVATLQTAIRALGTIDSFDFSSNTVTAKTLTVAV
jgi:uncharacterized protein YciI